MNAVSLVIGGKNADQAREIFHASLNSVISDAGSAASEARGYETVQQWRGHLQGRISVAALGTSVIPGLHGPA